jgi:hypothetical protein
MNILYRLNDQINPTGMNRTAYTQCAATVQFSNPIRDKGIVTAGISNTFQNRKLRTIVDKTFTMRPSSSSPQIPQANRIKRAGHVNHKPQKPNHKPINQSITLLQKC